ncbi:MAG: helix-turn-helix transcriptional regulator [Planctomycetes bacterium]|nr:helix-turn-helix transcriptional regulator [Planctomycetota bacterium]
MMFGDIIRQARKKQNLSQRELAKLTGLTQAGISKLERGICNPSLKTMRKINQVLKIQDKIFPPKEHMIDNKIDTDVEKRIEKRIEERLEERIEERLETRLEERLETRLESKLKKNITNDLLNEFDKRLKDEFDKRFEPILQILTKNLSYKSCNAK